MPLIKRAGMKEGGWPHSPAFQYLILMTWRACNLNWSWYPQCLQNGKSLTFFSCFMKWNWRPLSLNSWHFEASKDVMTKFKSQALHIIRIKFFYPTASATAECLACLWSKMPTYVPEGAFQYLILRIWISFDLNLVMTASRASKGKDFKLRGLQFQFIKCLQNGHLKLTGKSLSEDLVFASINPPWKLQAQNMGRACSAHVLSFFFFLTEEILSITAGSDRGRYAKPL